MNSKKSMSIFKILILSSLVFELDRFLLTDAKSLRDNPLYDQYITDQNIDTITNDGTENFICMQCSSESNGIHHTESK